MLLLSLCSLHRIFIWQYTSWVLSPRPSRALLQSWHPIDRILPIFVSWLDVGVIPATAIPMCLRRLHGTCLSLTWFPIMNFPASCLSMKSAIHVPQEGWWMLPLFFFSSTHVLLNHSYSIRVLWCRAVTRLGPYLTPTRCRCLLILHTMVPHRLSIYKAYLASFLARLLQREDCSIWPVVLLHGNVFAWNSLVHLIFCFFVRSSPRCAFTLIKNVAAPAVVLVPEPVKKTTSQNLWPELIDWLWLLIFRTNLVRGPWNKVMKFQNKGAVLVQIAPLFI